MECILILLTQHLSSITSNCRTSARVIKCTCIKFRTRAQIRRAESRHFLEHQVQAIGLGAREPAIILRTNPLEYGRRFAGEAVSLGEHFGPVAQVEKVNEDGASRSGAGIP